MTIQGGQLRLETAGESFSARLEKFYAADRSPCLGEQLPTLAGQHRKATTAIEQADSDLTFQIRQGLAYHGLSPFQAAAGGRETAFVRGCDERAELVQ